MNNEGWKKAEVYYQKELADLSYDTQFKVFELANDVLRNPDLVKTNVEKYGIFYEEFRLDNKWAVYYSIIMMVRRICLILVLLLFVNKPWL